jgi:hypothetical protein
MQRMQLNKATGAKCFSISASALQIPRQLKWIRVGSDFDYSKRGKRFEQFPTFLVSHRIYLDPYHI